jgi:hypothetical protein
MAAEPYWIELRGGRFDGYRRGCSTVPTSRRLELPTGALSETKVDGCRTAVYELEEVTVERRQGMPVMVYRFRHAGVTVNSRPNGWLARILRKVRTGSAGRGAAH